MKWYFSKAGQQEGPVSEEEMVTLIRSGVLSEDTLVWQEAFGSEWKPIGEVPVFAAYLPQEAPDSTTPPLPVQSVTPGPIVCIAFPPGGEFTRRARESLIGNWGVAVGANLLFFLVTMLAGNIPLAALFITGPMLVGFSRFFQYLHRKKHPEMDVLFSGFTNFGNALGTYVVSNLFILLWSLLLIIPGIIATFAYSQVYFLLSDHPELSPLDAIQSSRVLMQGRKWDLFLLRLRFLGWWFVGLLSFGIGFLWIVPYWMAAEAAFYQELRARERR